MGTPMAEGTARIRADLTATLMVIPMAGATARTKATRMVIPMVARIRAKPSAADRMAARITEAARAIRTATPMAIRIAAKAAAAKAKGSASKLHHL